MKKKWIEPEPGYSRFKKLLLAMRLALFLMIVTVFSSSAAMYGQTTKLDLSIKDRQIRDILNQIEDRSEYSFMYDNNQVDVLKKVSVEVKSSTIENILDEIFRGSGVTYKIIDRHIMLYSDNTSVVLGQQEGITGNVTDSSGSPLPGVTVLVKGTTTGIVTDVNGNFSLENVPLGSTLVFSFVGMKTQEVPIAGKSVVDVTMEEDAIGIEEVVAIGYGTIRKSDLTGSVVKVDVEKLSELPNISVIQSMQGIVPGLNVSAIDRPGQEPDLSIRGQNSLSKSSADNAPLIVVDGSIYRGNIIDINPDDIESVDILKDASSAAIYGSQASSGVMLITTKKGIELGKPIISYSASYSLETASNVLRPMKSAELDGFFRDAMWLNSRLGPDYLQPNPDYNLTQFLKTNEIVQGYNNGLDEDWWGGLTRNGSINNHNISLRGKAKNVGYFISCGYTDVKGFMLNDDYNRFSTRMNLDASINSWMNVGIESFITSSDYSGNSPDVNNAFLLQPWAPIKDDEGKLILFPEGGILNPYAQLEVMDSEKRLNIFGNIHAEIKFPVRGLSYKINYSQNYQTLNKDQFDPYGANLTGMGYKNSYIGYDWSVDNILSFTRTFNKIHKINATLVYGVEKRIGSNTNASAQKFTNGTLGYNRLESGDPSLNGIDTGAWQETSLYSMGRIIYNLNNRYLLTGTIRRDGFSGFGADRKIGLFPSAAFGWVASEESFVKDNIDWMEYLKLRASYGSTGRRAVNRYQTMATMSSAPAYIFGEGGSTVIGQRIVSLANNDLGWETTTGLNFGFDFALINSRIHGNFEYYDNNTKDILYNIQLPRMTGFSSIATNIGKVHNHGFELSVTGIPVKSKDFSWESTVNYSRNRNKIVSILGFDNNEDGKEDDLVSNGLFIGEPQQVIYDYEITGMWQLEDAAVGLIPNGFSPGTYKIADLSGPDGEPDGAYSASYDKKILGYLDPAYRISWVNNLIYKQFNLYIVINSIQGGKNFYMGDDSPYSSGAWSHVEQLKYLNVPSGAWDYWMPENPDAKYRRLDAGTTYAPHPYSQRNFIRLQDVLLSYTFDKKIIGKLDIGALKLFISAKNLITLTKWKGWDPETGQGFGPGTPLMRNYTIGLNVEF